MIVLDTHVWLWWVNQTPKLKIIWLEYIEQAEQVGISAISLFEVKFKLYTELGNKLIS